MRRALRPLAALAMVALLSAGCSNATAQTGTGSSGGNSTTNRDQAVKFAECMREERRQGVPGPERVGRAHHRWDSERLVAGPEQRGVQAGHRRV